MQRKIIHIDMDCFYAAIEVRDKPELAAYPVAVGGDKLGRRGVLCTCNYLARKFGVRSAMPTAKALELCPDLKVLPVNMEKYKIESQAIRDIFKQYTEQMEPLSLDEAYLDVTNCKQHGGSATLIAEHIRYKIYQERQLTASAGVAPNKLLAKIASDWHKPNGLFVITPDELATFIRHLPVEKIFGVGKVTQEKCHRLDLYTCADIQQTPLAELIKHFGKFGVQLHQYSHGIDPRLVNTHRQRKSLSVEQTYTSDIADINTLKADISRLINKLQQRLEGHASRDIHKLVVKLKFTDFTLTSVERLHNALAIEHFESLLESAWRRKSIPVRLLGIGVRFTPDNNQMRQLDLW